MAFERRSARRAGERSPRQPRFAAQVPLGGDVILSIEGIQPVSEDNIEKIRNRLAAAAPDTPFKADVLRAGKIITLTGTAQ